jgi:glycyl-tRNA synthetase beta chain
MPDLLIELFSEEIPARMQARAAQDLKKLVTDGLVEAGLTYGSAASFATPRRLTLAVGDMLAASPTTREERKGPRADAPQKASDGFLRGAGLDRDQLQERDTPKGAVLFAVIEKPGQPAETIVAQVLEQAIRQFPWPKAMRWGSGSLRWVRPLHSILCVLTDETGSRVVPMDVDGISSGDVTYGHRFHAPGALRVSGFEDYALKLRKAQVVLDAQERSETIWNDAGNLAFASGLEVVEDKGLLAEVAGLVEWPVTLMGRIDPEFLSLPAEVLQTSMKEHQKFFSVRDPKTGRIERFITVANRDTADHGATILAGNQKVLAARLADAKFFWENDLRVANSERGMARWTDNLANVTFHNKLGTQADLIERMAHLARALAPLVGANADLAEQAARIAKADLSSEMVYEFPELQGVMGRYYALAAGMDAAVAQAAPEHYAPLGPSDAVPTQAVSIAVALAEKIDKLTGFWAIDEKPTGSKDPFALRRAALGVIRILIENDISLDLRAVLEISAGIVGPRGDAQALADSGDILAFVHDRLKVYLRDQGLRHDIIDACLATGGAGDLAVLIKRAKALDAALRTEDGENLIQGFKRANNILTQAEQKDGVEYSFGADIKFTETEAERVLFTALETAEAQVAPALEAQDFGAAMAAIAALRGPVDGFFEAVQVNSDTPAVRRNRLNLLSQIRAVCLQMADLSRLEG